MSPDRRPVLNAYRRGVPGDALALGGLALVLVAVLAPVGGPRWSLIGVGLLVTGVGFVALTGRPAPDEPDHFADALDGAASAESDPGRIDDRE